MRDMLACQCWLMLMAAYLLTLLGISMWIGAWVLAPAVLTFVPALFGAYWLTDRLVPRR